MLQNTTWRKTTTPDFAKNPTARRSVEDFMKEWLPLPSQTDNDEIKDPRKYLSSTTIKEVHDILRPFFRKAEEYKLISETPVPHERPVKREHERTICHEETMAQALKDLEDNPLPHLAIHCAFVWSLRNEETMSITLDNIDLEHDQIFH